MQVHFTRRELYGSLLAGLAALAAPLAGCAGPEGVPPAGVVAPDARPASPEDSALTISSAYGAVQGTLVITVTSSVEGAAIRYHAGASNIDTESPGDTVPYQGPFVLWPRALTENSSAVVWAVATVDGVDRPATWRFFAMGLPPDPRPVFTPPPGTYGTPQNVSITTSVPDAAIVYTLDGSEPRWDSMHYTSPVAVDATTTIRAMAVLGYDSTPVVEARYSF
jgi:predicted small lipoprotein YifL